MMAIFSRFLLPIIAIDSFLACIGMWSLILCSGFINSKLSSISSNSLLKDIFSPETSTHWWMRLPEGVVTQREKIELLKKTQELINNRIKVYENQTAVLAEYYKAQNKLATVNGVGSVDQITERLYRSIDL